MRTQLNPLMMINKYERFFTAAGTQTLTLSPGRYLFVMRGGGGGGGENGSNGRWGAGGAGGAGGMGEIQTETILITEPTSVELYVGAGGLTYANGGNGGAGGSAGFTGGAGGRGGGGGMPSYIVINNEYYVANGGGGGGGGGGGSTTSRERYAYGAGGGGGGGYYRFTNGTITSVPGQKGGNCNTYPVTMGQAGTAGNTTDFPDIKSGDGGGYASWVGYNYNGAKGASGGGASGAGGGGESQNTDYSAGGAGGGGAGGSTDAGGGKCGSGGAAAPTDASNPHTTPTDTTFENAQNGITGNYGIGGGVNTNGADGFVYIKRVGWE